MSVFTQLASPAKIVDAIIPTNVPWQDMLSYIFLAGNTFVLFVTKCLLHQTVATFMSKGNMGMAMFACAGNGLSHQYSDLITPASVTCLLNNFFVIDKDLFSIYFRVEMTWFVCDNTILLCASFK